MVNDKSLIDVLRDGCEHDDSKILCNLMMEGAEFTYGEMLEKAEKLATGLISLGHKQGDRIGIWGPNQSQWIISMWAVAMAGMQLVTINPMYTAKELEYAINKVDITALICPQEIGPLDYRNTISQMLPQLENSSAPGSLNFENVSTLRNIIYFNKQEDINGVFDFDDVFQAGESEHLKILNQTKIE